MCPRLRVLGCALILASATPAGAARAQATLVVIAGEGELGQRILGQIGDLPIETALAPPVATTEAIATVAQRTAADVLVTWTTDADGITLRLFEPRTGRTLIRQVALPVSAGPEERSTTLEAAGLIVRGGLRDILASRSLERESRVATPVQPRPTTERIRGGEAPEADERSGSEVDGGESASSSVGFVGQVGWRVGVDGRSPVGLHAADLSVGLSWRRLRVDVTGGIGPPTTTTDQWTEVSLLTLRTVLGARLELLQHPSWSVTIGADAGATFWHRRSRSLSEIVVTTPDKWSSSAVIGPRLGAAFFPRGLGGGLGLRLDLAVDVLPLAPRFVYGDATTSAHGTLWNVQPWLRLSVAFRAPP